MMDETLDNQKTFEDDGFSSISPVKLAPGMLLGENRNYRLEKLLGSGTYGQAWLAAEIEGGNELRKVVCKVLPALIQKEKDEMAKVIRTFQLVQPLIHQYICPIYALKSDPNCGYFFVMAYADGGTLWEWFVSQPNHANGLPVSRVVEVLRPVAMALDHAHANGVVHRDVKPQNILLALRAGRKIPWLIDFGISAQIHRTVTQTIGARGRTGTPAFMAPEQCLPNQTQDGRTDQYALGVLAYLFLSGRLPFDADDPVALWGQIVYTPAPALENVPQSVNSVIHRALAKKREERFGSCVEFINALKKSVVSTHIVTQPKAPIVSTHVVTQPKAPIVLKKITVPGTFATLEEACEKAPDGALITIKPGKYTLSKTIILSRSITLHGETGRAEDVVIDCPTSNAFEITGGSPSFQNLTASSGAETCGGFSIRGGTPNLFRCVVTSRNGCGMYVWGKGADPKVEKCVMKDCCQTGVLVYMEGCGEFRDCDIYRNVLAGIEVRESGNPTFTGCKIHDGKGAGVLVWQSGFGEFQNCEIYGNEMAGIAIHELGNPTFTSCSIHDGKNAGVFVYTEGLGKFQNCDIYKNEASGIEIQSAGNPTLIGCRIHESKLVGALIHMDGQGVFNNCEIYQNGYSGFEVASSGNPIVTECVIHDGKQAGVLVHSEGNGLFQNCEICGNRLSGIVVRDSGNPTVVGCKIHHGKLDGVSVFDKGMGTFKNNTLSENYINGIVVNWNIAPFGGCKVQGSGNNPELPKTFFEKLFG